MNDLTSPTDMGDDFPDWLKYLLLGIGLLIALPVLYWLVKFAVWLASLLLKGLASVFRGIGNAAKKRKKNERKNE